MAALRIALELGPKGKKVVAYSPDWPGLERGDKTENAVVERLQSYVERYARVPQVAGIGKEYSALSGVEIVERYEGVGSTDFWGISFAFSSLDTGPETTEELKREVTLMRACWTYFDEVRARVSAEMQKGPRGGGRDRDRIVRHVFATEQDWGKKLRIRGPHEPFVVDDEGVRIFREEYTAAIMEFHAEGKRARNWPLRYLVRHTAYHAMDHAWEMEDKDLTGAAA
jgi:hypothetical protein